MYRRCIGDISSIWGPSISVLDRRQIADIDLPPKKADPAHSAPACNPTSQQPMPRALPCTRANSAHVRTGPFNTSIPPGCTPRPLGLPAATGASLCKTRGLAVYRRIRQPRGRGGQAASDSVQVPIRGTLSIKILAAVSAMGHPNANTSRSARKWQRVSL